MTVTRRQLPSLAVALLAATTSLAAFVTPASAAAKVQRIVSPGGIEAWFVQDATVPLIAMEYAFSGGAALSREVAEFVDGLGITVYEGYGLTETSPIATVNRPGGHRIGSVGQPLPGVKIVIDKAASGDPKHGEIIVYGDK